MSTLAKKYIFKALCEKPQNKQPLPKHLNTSEKKNQPKSHYTGLYLE